MESQAKGLHVYRFQETRAQLVVYLVETSDDAPSCLMVF